MKIVDLSQFNVRELNSCEEKSTIGGMPWYVAAVLGYLLVEGIKEYGKALEAGWEWHVENGGDYFCPARP